MDSGANIFICECGDNFTDSKLLKEHCAQTHPSKIVPQEYHAKRVAYRFSNHFLQSSHQEISSSQLLEMDDGFIPAPPKKTTAFSQKPPTYIVTKNVVCEKVMVPLSNDIMQSLENHLEEHHAEKIMEDLVNMPVKVEALEQQEEEINYEYQTIVTSENRIMNEHNYDKTVIVTEYYCDVCGKSFQKDSAVKRHIQIQHIQSFSCEFCEAKFSKERGLLCHLESKHGVPVEKPALPKKFACDQCDSAFACAASLKCHKRKHTGERPYQCTVCGKSFVMPLHLQIHTRIHTGEKPYQCEHCPKAFNNPGALWRHRKVHTGEKPYECSSCQKCFSQSNSLKLHFRTVHLKQPTPYKSKARKTKVLANAKVNRRSSTESPEPMEYITYDG